MTDKCKQTLYIFDELEKLDGGYVSRSIPYLSDERRRRVFSYRFEADRRLSAAAYLLLRLALCNEFGIDEPIAFSYASRGKPLLRDYPLIHFNLSHCRSAVACVVSETEAGVDAQEITPISDGVAEKVLNSSEFKAYKTSENPFALFCKYWAIKESLLKRTGIGITADLTQVSAENAAGTVLYKGTGYFCCAAVNPGAPVNIQAKYIRFSKEANVNGGFFS